MTKILQLSIGANTSIHRGKSFDDVGERQKRRKIMAIKEALRKSLWFLNTFKLDIHSFVLSSQISQQSTIQLSSHTGNSKNTHPSPEHIDEILFLLDSYGISDEFYHKLSMVHPSLPQSYLVKQRQTNISSNIPSHRLQEPFSGCYRSLKDSIIEALSSKVNNTENYTSIILTLKESPQSPILVKISGDGAQFHRSSS